MFFKSFTPSVEAILVFQAVFVWVLLEALPPPQVVAKAKLEANHQATFPYCVFVEGKSEIDCTCDEWEADDGFVKFPADGFFAETNEIRKTPPDTIRFHSCQKIQLRLDLSLMPITLKKLRFENIGDVVRIKDLVARPDDDVQIAFKNVSKGVFISGEISRPETKGIETNSGVDIKITDTSNATLEGLMVDRNDVDFRIGMTSGATFSISDSYFSHLEKSSIEIFGVEQVEIFHTEFLNVTNGAIVVDADVKVVSVVDSIMEKEVLETLSASDTNVTFICTSSPSQPNTDPSCAGRQLSRSSSVESTGAVVIAIVSGSLLLTAVGVLFFLHRHGKLEQYL